MGLEYSKAYIEDIALSVILDGSKDSRHSWVKRALKKGTLVRLKRGLYLIGEKASSHVDPFEMAQQLYGPSYVSFESALAYHGWIPEAVYITTSATSKRRTIIQTPIGTFNYEHTPQFQFFMGVERVSTPKGVFLMAHPWKAVADYFYSRRKKWQTLNDLIDDLRLDETMVQNSDKSVLDELNSYYASPRVRHFTRMILGDLKRWI